jgi:hypothetical protein
MSGYLTVSGATKRDPNIDLWLNAAPDELHSIASKWFARMRKCGGDVGELMHDGCPVACVEDAPFAYVNIFKAHVNVGFFNGAMLADPAGLLLGSGKRMRHVKLLPYGDENTKALEALIVASYLGMKAELKRD